MGTCRFSSDKWEQLRAYLAATRVHLSNGSMRRMLDNVVRHMDRLDEPDTGSADTKAARYREAKGGE